TRALRRVPVRARRAAIRHEAVVRRARTDARRAAPHRLHARSARRSGEAGVARRVARAVTGAAAIREAIDHAVEDAGLAGLRFPVRAGLAAHRQIASRKPRACTAGAGPDRIRTVCTLAVAQARHTERVAVAAADTTPVDRAFVGVALQ